jgi:hypothetical protein
MKTKKPKTNDAELLLKLIQKGLARFEPSTGEFCFQGMRYGASAGDWSRVVDVIGRARVVTALS